MATADVLLPHNPFVPTGLPADHPPVPFTSSSSRPLTCPFAPTSSSNSKKSSHPKRHPSSSSESSEEADLIATIPDYHPSGVRLPDLSLHMSPVTSVDAPTSALLTSVKSTFLPTSSSYASHPIPLAFNWSALSLSFDDPEGLDAERTWYGVAFRSRRKYRDDSELASYYSHHLYLADSFAHAEANKSNSLLFYFYGTPSPDTGMNLATCLWQSREAAREATKGQRHKEAVAWVGEAYEEYTLERYVVRKRRGETGVTVEDWEGQEIGYFP